MSAQIQEEAYEAPHDSDVQTEAVAQNEDSDNSQEAADRSNPVSSPSQNNKDYNWSKARQQLEELQYENRKLRELVEARSKPTEDEYSELEKLAEDDILTKAQTAKLTRKETKALLKQTIAEMRKEMLMETLEERIERKYPDFNQVATEQNLDELKRDPLFVKSLKGLDNPYDQACFIYEQLKLRGISQSTARERAQLEKNATKPRSVNAVGGASPLHGAYDFSQGLTPKLKEQLLQEMVQASKGA